MKDMNDCEINAKGWHNADETMILERYRVENRLIHALSLGQINEAEMAINSLNLLELNNEAGLSTARMRCRTIHTANIRL